MAFFFPFGFVFLYLLCTFVTSDLCIVLSLYEKMKKKNTTGVALLKVLIWILFLYPNDVVYFAFCKLNLNDICKNVKAKGKWLLWSVDPLNKFFRCEEGKKRVQNFIYQGVVLEGGGREKLIKPHIVASQL